MGKIYIQSMKGDEPFWGRVTRRAVIITSPNEIHVLTVERRKKDGRKKEKEREKKRKGKTPLTCARRIH